MKRFNKMLAMALAFLLCLSVSTVALAEVPTSQKTPTGEAAAPNADGKYTISVKEDDTHTYTVYQILTGTLVPGESKLGNAAWGADAKGDGKVEDFVTSITKPGLTNAQINDLVKAQLKDGATGQGTISKDKSLDVAPGYYLIVDTTEADELAKGDAYSLNIVAVFNNIEIEPKKGTTQSDKKVDDNDADKAANGSEWIDSADYSIGDTVPYKLSATVAEDYANYTKGYKLTFHDKMSAGLTFNPGTVVVKVGDTTIDSSKYEVVTAGLTDGCTFEVKFADLKSVTEVQAGSVITVEFNATLNEGAVIGSGGNPNTSHVTFTNNPNDNQVGENGKTPDDTVIVFTYKTVFNKIDSNNKPLKGADFMLEKKVGEEWVNVTQLHSGDGSENPIKTIEGETKFTFAGLDAGDYRLTETTTPSGYNTIAPIEFTITATHDILSDSPTLTALTGTDGKQFTMTPDVTKATLTSDIVNQQGSELPSTGGMGTTLLYTIGGVLVAVSAVGLIARRKMSAEQ